MASLLASHQRRAAHSFHRCGCCGGRIPRGDQYLDQRVADNGTVWTFRTHAVCDRVYWRLHREFGMHEDDIVSAEEIRATIRHIFEWMAGAD